MYVFNHWLIDWLNGNLSLWCSFYNFTVLIVNQSKVKTCLQRLVLKLIYTLNVFGVLYFGVLVLILASLIVNWFVRFDWISVHWYRYFSSYAIEQRKYAFYFPVVLNKGVVRVLVGCNCSLTPINCFAWSKISFKLTTQAFFCWLLTCVFSIYWTSVNWYWNLSLGVIVIFQWAITNQTYIFSFPEVLWKVMVRVMVLWLYLS